MRNLKEKEERECEKKRVIERVKKEDERRNPMKKEEEEGTTKRHIETKETAPLDAFKCRIPPFARDGDVEAFLDWEMKVDQVLDYFNYHDFLMVTYKLTGYALVWWNQFYREIKEGKRKHVDTWIELMCLHHTRGTCTTNCKGSTKDPKVWKNITKTWSSHY
ncbi:hypothetical protein CR513_06359, partial [Mucuna pruriens]